MTKFFKILAMVLCTVGSASAAAEPERFGNWVMLRAAAERDDARCLIGSATQTLDLRLIYYASRGIEVVIKAELPAGISGAYRAGFAVDQRAWLNVPVATDDEGRLRFALADWQYAQSLIAAMIDGNRLSLLSNFGQRVGWVSLSGSGKAFEAFNACVAQA